MDSHQAIYDAVRSRISNGDIGYAVESAMRDANISHYFDMASQAWQQAAAEQQRPCILLRPKLSIEGNQWCALYGNDLQEGIAGFGDSPAKAFYDFDAAFYKSLPAKGAGHE